MKEKQNFFLTEANKLLFHQTFKILGKLKYQFDFTMQVPNFLKITFFLIRKNDFSFRKFMKLTKKVFALRKMLPIRNSKCF